ncbi:DUF3658 domain-containing protein [Teredinibacter turnerae]|uniref:DUF3658 domain-containing protein n=1 Tax=Teredinibacter turnerae TaxID=2426 RepID=UPI00037058CA|nr:DUF3658 domain-containing protein [Teredinibacter turnerae]
MSSDKVILEKVEEALKVLEDALSLVINAQENDYSVGKLGRAIGMLREFQSSIYDKNPDLRPSPPWHDMEVPSLTEEQVGIVSNITREELEKIDSELLLLVSDRYQKVAKIVRTYMFKNEDLISEVPDLFYGLRIKQLAEAGKIEFQGNLEFMQYCEVKAIKT